MFLGFIGMIPSGAITGHRFPSPEIPLIIALA